MLEFLKTKLRENFQSEIGQKICFGLILLLMALFIAGVMGLMLTSF